MLTVICYTVCVTRKLPNLQNEQTLVILAYADAGLGHLRVTNALFEGLPKEVNPVLMKSKEASIQDLHRLTSSNPLFRKFLAWTQKGKQEEFVSNLYIYQANLQTKPIQRQLEEILEQQMHVAHKVVIVCTHFGLAHQLSKLKNTIEKKWKVNLFLAVTVTDDSPQVVWYVPGADLISVPSKSTKVALENYRKERKLPKVDIRVFPYPVSPILGKKFQEVEFRQKNEQLDPKSEAIINISLPVSGAAAGLDYSNNLMKNLHRLNPRFVFNIVTHDNIFTKAFIEKNMRRSYSTVLESSHSRRVVRLYDKMFLNSILSLEVTKPSEQCFKALFNPRQRGGVILLLSEPVGRQEYDNLQYLQRNRLIPSDNDQEKLFLYANENLVFSEEGKKSLMKKAQNWRGLRLPNEPKKAAHFINWCLYQRIFVGMGHSTLDKSNGVERFWSIIDTLVES